MFLRVHAAFSEHLQESNLLNGKWLIYDQVRVTGIGEQCLATAGIKHPPIQTENIM
jgi:hypothetical protein